MESALQPTDIIIAVEIPATEASAEADLVEGPEVVDLIVMSLNVFVWKEKQDVDVCIYKNKLFYQ